MVDASTLNINTALETCQNFPQDGICAICLFSLVPESADDGNTDADEAGVVIAKVCGDKHHFHRTCIMAWFNSSTPTLNECPLDRNVLYGHGPVRQFPVNIARPTMFPGHNPEDHETFYANHPNPEEEEYDYEERSDEMYDDTEEELLPYTVLPNLVRTAIDPQRGSSRQTVISDLAILARAHSLMPFEIFAALPHPTAGDLLEFNRIRNEPIPVPRLQGLSFTLTPRGSPVPLPTDDPEPSLNGDMVGFWNSSGANSVESFMASTLEARETEFSAWTLFRAQIRLTLERPNFVEPGVAMAVADYIAEFGEPNFDSPDFSAHALRFWEINPQFRPDNAPSAELEQVAPFTTLTDDGVEPRRYL